MEPIIRRFCPEDAKMVHQIEAECFSHPWSLSEIEALAEDEKQHTFVAADGEDHAAVLGYLNFYTVLDEGYICNVAVTGKARRKGIGKGLIQAALEEGKRLSLSFLTLEVRRSNSPAIALYESCGFEKAGVRPGFYDDPKEDAWLMTCFFPERD